MFILAGLFQSANAQENAQSRQPENSQSSFAASATVQDSPRAAIAAQTAASSFFKIEILKYAGTDKKFPLFTGYRFACVAPDRGTDRFGDLYRACDAETFADVDAVMKVYSPDFVYDTLHADDAHRSEYMTNMHALIRRIALNFYRKRVPQATQLEQEAWVRAVLALATQESLMSHYRIGRDDGRLKIIMGDGAQSLGMMQFLQKLHSDLEAVDLARHILAGCQMLFEHWSQWPITSCRNDLIKTQPSPEEELLAHSQSAYAGYNSGSRYCRYLDSSSKYAGNDQGYLRRLTLQPWRDLVTDFDREVKLNIDCLLDGDNLCAIAKPMTDDMKLAHHAVVVDSGATCLTQDEVQFSCVRDSRDSECLLATDSLARAQTPIRFKSIDPDWQTVTPERSEICGRVTRNLAAVGQFIEVRRTIAVATQGALDNDTVPTFLTQGQVVQVLDFEVKANGRRSYKISLPSIDASEPPVVGWINAGDNRDADDWVRVMADNEPHGSPGSILPSPIVTIPVVGSKVELRGGGPVTAFGGILIWGSPSDAQSSHAKPVGRLPYGAQVRVLETVITGTDNQVYLRVDTNPMGYVYGGKTYPALTVFDWVRILP